MNLSNLREAGGMSASGGHIATDVLYRSAAPHRLDDELTQWVNTQQITSIFDLRSSQETQRMPGFPAVFGTAVRTALPLLEGAVDSVAQFGTLDALYPPLVAEHGPVWAQLAAGIADTAQASLVHCTAGKDRTGVGIALVLLAVGADYDAVMQDYVASTPALSGQWLDTMTAMMAQHGVQVTPQLRTLLVGTTVTGMERALEIARGYGSFADYLLAHGLSPAQLETLGQKLVVG